MSSRGLISINIVKWKKAKVFQNMSQGSKDLKECHWHLQIESMLTSHDGLYHHKKGFSGSEAHLRRLATERSNDGEVLDDIVCPKNNLNTVEVLRTGQEIADSAIGPLVKNIASASTSLDQEMNLSEIGMRKPLGRPRKILEPEHLRGVIKECPRCSSHDTKFQYFNNNKESQPRYKCGNCTTKFTFNGRVNKKPHPQPPQVVDLALVNSSQTSTKGQENFVVSGKEVFSEETPETDFVHPAPLSAKTHIMYFNNENESQSRYVSLNYKELGALCGDVVVSNNLEVHCPDGLLTILLVYNFFFTHLEYLFPYE